MSLPVIISIQSQVAWGHVGNSAAAFPMRAAGVDIVEVPTTLLSNHPHYPTMRGRFLESDLVADLLRGIEEREIPGRAAAILSGFLGHPETAGVVADFVKRAKRANPNLLYACDPVMGDHDIGFFVSDGLRDAFTQTLVPLSDIALPNAFELQALTGRTIAGPEDVAEARCILGVPAIIAKSVPVPDRPDLLDTVTVTDRELASAIQPHIAVRPAGTGDLFAGLTLARHVQGLALPLASARAAAGVLAALSRTAATPWAEMPITEAIADILDAQPAQGPQGAG